MNATDSMIREYGRRNRWVAEFNDWVRQLSGAPHRSVWPEVKEYNLKGLPPYEAATQYLGRIASEEPHGLAPRPAAVSPRLNKPPVRGETGDRRHEHGEPPGQVP